MVFLCVWWGGGGRAKRCPKKKKMTRRDSPNSSNPLTVSMVGAARMVLLK